MATLTRPVSRENKILPGIWRFCQELGNLGIFLGSVTTQSAGPLQKTISTLNKIYSLISENTGKIFQISAKYLGGLQVTLHTLDRFELATVAIQQYLLQLYMYVISCVTYIKCDCWPIIFLVQVILVSYFVTWVTTDFCIHPVFNLKLWD